MKLSDNFQEAQSSNWDHIARLLVESDLPYEDLSPDKQSFIMYMHNGEIAGVIALEEYGSSGLLRSLIVQEKYRKRSIGQSLIKEMERIAQERGIQNLYLLTTTVSNFAKKFGYYEIDRGQVPEEIAQTPEFVSLCPLSATCMMKDLESAPQIIAASEKHLQQIKSIYSDGIKTGNATFVKSCEDLNWKVWKTIYRCSFVAINSKAEILGWAGISQISARKVYIGVGETSVYVSGQHKNQGIGKMLLSTLINKSESEGFWTLQAGIFPENKVSIHLHTQLGFKIIGVREKIGKMTFGPFMGKWRNTVLLERRSKLGVYQ